MYNLLISANKDEWNGAPFVLEKDRFLEYTQNNIVEKYKALTGSDINKIKKLPCIFAYENFCQKSPRFGYIEEVTERQGKLKIKYEIVTLEKFLSFTDLSEMLFDLDIDKYEINRTHWSIKDIDLNEELRRKDIIISSKVKGGLPKDDKIISVNKPNYKLIVLFISVIFVLILWFRGVRPVELKILGLTYSFRDQLQNGSLISSPTKTISTIVSSDINNISKKDNLRSLEPLETGRRWKDIANGTYFYTYGHEIDFVFRLRRLFDDNTATNDDDIYHYEVQKVKNIYYILGYIDDLSFSKLGTISKEKPIETILSPVEWAGLNKLIAIPSSSLRYAAEREIDVEKNRSMRILDIKIESASNNFEIHRNKLL